jgi:Na+/proline symporter
MIGCVVLAIIVVQLPEVGGLDGMKAKLSSDVLDFFPRIGELGATGITGGVLSLTAGAFAAYVGLQWWSSWYPGADPGGGGYIAQRMMACKDEKQSLFATLWFTIAHYTLRPWPWILVALSALVILPRAENTTALQNENPAFYQQAVQVFQNSGLLKNGDAPYRAKEFLDFYEKYENTVDPGVLYPKLMLRFLPSGLLGLLIAVFLAAYMSTISSQISWGTSYLINDFYRRFIRKDAGEKHYVLISRFGIALMVIVSLIVTNFLTTISGAWEFIINASAGMGAVLILRWFWWRINAWSEIAAMLAPLVIYPIARANGFESPLTLYPVVLGTTVIWLIATFVTPPVAESVLLNFYKKTHPGGIGWKPIAQKLPEVKSDSGFGRLFVNWLCGVAMIYSTLFGIGRILFGQYRAGFAFLAVVAAAAWIIQKNLKAMSFRG